MNPTPRSLFAASFVVRDSVRFRRIALLAVWWLSMGALLPSGLGARDVPAQPNIVLILADDWGWGDLGIHGHPYVKTPHIDRIAREGTDFTRFTVASGVCSPSRTAIQTGQFPARFSINGHFAWVENNARRGMPDWLSLTAPSLPRLLQSAGYATGHFGKWHLSNNMIPDSPTPDAYGHNEYGAFNCAGEQMPVHEDARHAITFMGKAVAAGKPFFVNLWIHEPHTPFHTVPKYEWRFRHLANEEDRIYASVLSHADDRIGEVMTALQQLGVDEHTLVIFSSDNGPARARGDAKLELMHDTATGAGWGLAASKGITGGRKGYKAALFEGGIGVPFLARWPGRIPAGRIDDRSLISAVDLLPTFCDLAGATLPADVAFDGVSQTEVLFGQEAPRRQRPLFWHSPSTWPAHPLAPDHWVSWAVVHDEWKLVANADMSHTELYHISSDFAEERDLRIQRPETEQRLLALLQEWRATLPTAPAGDVFSTLRSSPDSGSSP